MKLAIILVHYHTPDLAIAAHEALAADLRASGMEAEWLLVDNGSDDDERRRLDSLPVRRVEPGRNSGYAAGANIGVRHSSAEFIFLMNPDVLVQPGCSAALVDALENGAAAAGPRFFWDHDRQFLLPPTERRTRVDELWRFLGDRGHRWAAIPRARWRRHAWRCWNAGRPLPCYELSGALLAFHRQAWEETGGFDEGYQLYFEETDWLERLRRLGLEARYVPQAEAVHLYAQSTLGEPRAASWFADSDRRFRRRFYGGSFTTLVDFIGRWWPPVKARESVGGSVAVSDDVALQAGSWLEVSSSAVGYPAAVRNVTGTSSGGVDFSPAMERQLPPGTYYLRTVDAQGSEISVRVYHHAKRASGTS